MPLRNFPLEHCFHSDTVQLLPFLTFKDETSLLGFFFGVICNLFIHPSLPFPPLLLAFEP